MARSSKLGETVGGLVTLGTIVYLISNGIADYLHISGFLAFLILVGIYLALVGIVKAIAAFSAQARRNRPCSHGVRRGKDGGCADCIAEDERREAERRASQAIYERLAKIKKEAAALRAAQLRDLTNKWLSKPDLYPFLWKRTSAFVPIRYTYNGVGEMGLHWMTGLKRKPRFSECLGSEGKPLKRYPSLHVRLHQSFGRQLSAPPSPDPRLSCPAVNPALVPAESAILVAP